MTPQPPLYSSDAAAHIGLSFAVDGRADPVDLTVNELTVADVRRWLAEAAVASERDPLHALALPDIGIDDLARMTSASVDILEALTVRQLQVVADTAREINPHFFRVRAAMDQAARAVQMETLRLIGQQRVSPGLTETLPD